MEAKTSTNQGRELAAVTNSAGIATFNIAGFGAQNLLAHSGTASTPVQLSWTTVPGETFTPLPLPTITGVKPGKYSVSGGRTVTVAGTKFTGATAVEFGAVNASSFLVESDTKVKGSRLPSCLAQWTSG
jgi:hypothetical protein